MVTSDTFHALDIIRALHTNPVLNPSWRTILISFSCLCHQNTWNTPLKGFRVCLGSEFQHIVTWLGRTWWWEIVAREGTLPHYRGKVRRDRLSAWTRCRWSLTLVSSKVSPHKLWTSSQNSTTTWGPNVQHLYHCGAFYIPTIIKVSYKCSILNIHE